MRPALRLLPFLLTGIILVLLSRIHRPTAKTAGERGFPPSHGACTTGPAREALDASCLLRGRSRARSATTPEAVSTNEDGTLPREGPARIDLVGTGKARRGVQVDVYGVPGEGHLCKWTDDEGSIHLSRVPYDGSVHVEADAPPLPPSRTTRAWTTIHGPRTLLPCSAKVPIKVTFRDAESGRELPHVPFRMGRTGKRREPSTTTSRHLDVEGDMHVLTWLKPRAPDGYVAFDGLEIRVDVSRRTHTLTFDAPLRREANVLLRSVDVGGHDVPDSAVVGVEVAGEITWGRPPVTREGNRLRVHGIPFLRQERIRLLVGRPEPRVPLWAMGLTRMEQARDSGCEPEVGMEDAVPEGMWNGRAFDPGKAAIAKDRLPRDGALPVLLTAVFDPLIGIRSVSRIPPFQENLDGWDDRVIPTGTVEIRVLDRQRAPLAGVEVLLWGSSARTDPSGRVRFEEIPEGAHTATLFEPGWVKTSRKLDVRAHAVTLLELVEDEGGEVILTVFDEHRDPLSFARILMPESAGWADVEDGVQRIDVTTDARGMRRLRRLPAGPLRLEVTWGERKATVDVEVESGRRRVLELELPASIKD